MGLIVKPCKRFTYRVYLCGADPHSLHPSEPARLELATFPLLAGRSNQTYLTAGRLNYNFTCLKCKKPRVLL